MSRFFRKVCFSNSLFFRVLFGVCLFFWGSLTAGCATHDAPKKSVEAPVEKEKISIQVPKGEGIDSQPCQNQDWTRLPPPPDDPDASSVPSEGSSEPEEPVSDTSGPKRGNGKDRTK